MTDWLDKSLQDLAAEDPPAEAMAEVRMRVFEQVRRPRRMWFWWLAPAAVAAGLAVWMVMPQADEGPAIIARAPSAPPVVMPAPVRAVETVRRPVAARPKRVEIAMAPEPRVLPTGTPDFVRIESGNPDVVILWSLNTATVNDQTGEQK